MDKYNPKQFEIIGIDGCKELFTPSKYYINPMLHNKDGKISSGSVVNTTLCYKLNSIPTNITYYTADNVNYPFKNTYARLLIKYNKQI